MRPQENHCHCLVGSKAVTRKGSLPWTVPILPTCAQHASILGNQVLKQAQPMYTDTLRTTQDNEEINYASDWQDAPKAQQECDMNSGMEKNE